MKNVRRQTSRSFRNRKKEYLKQKVNELETKSKNKNNILVGNLKGRDHLDYTGVDRNEILEWMLGI
jgi:hypothetical protein